MNILVTGISGFFGVALMRYLYSSGYSGKVCGISRNPLSLEKLRIKFKGFNSIELFCCDIFDAVRLQNIIEKNNITHIFHFAADSTNGPNMGFLDRYSQIVDGTKIVLESAYASGVKNVLIASSGAVYTSSENSDNLPYTETQMFSPSFEVNGPSIYRMAKANSEYFSRVYAIEKGLNIRVARCFSYVGEDLPLDKHFAIGNFLNDALNSREIIIKGSGLDIRSYMYQDDLARWLMAIGTHEMTGWNVYNVGSNVPISLGNLAELIKCISKNDKPTLMLGGKSQKATFYVPNTDKALNELGLKINYDLSHAIEQTFTKLQFQ